MPKVSKRGFDSRGIQEANRRWLEKKSIMNPDSSSSDGSLIGQLELNDDDFKPSVEASIEDIADLFQLCKERIEFKFISVLLFLDLRRFCVSFRNCKVFYMKLADSQLVRSERGHTSWLMAILTLFVLITVMENGQ
jgi:hypothetical protein